VKFTGHAILEMPGNADASWVEACTLRWLKGHDEVILTEAPRVGVTFTVVEDRLRTACRFTRVEPPIALSWEGADGSSAALEFQPQGDRTLVEYRAVYVPKHAFDKVAAGLISVFAHDKAQRETDNDAASELRNLARRVKLRTAGKPINDQRPRMPRSS
jgi:hypothetical protein